MQKTHLCVTVFPLVKVGVGRGDGMAGRGAGEVVTAGDVDLNLEVTKTFCP